MDVQSRLRFVVSLGGVAAALLVAGCAQQRSLSPSSTTAEPPRIRAHDSALGPGRGVSSSARDIERNLGF